MQPLRLIFAGTPEFAASHLYALLASPHKVVAVYTQPDRPSGRGKQIVSGPVKSLALENHLPVLQPPSLRESSAQNALATFEADLMVVVAYGLILPAAVLETPRFGCINVHASLLPRWRGAAPIEHAILAGDAESGVTIMQMDVGLDTGKMLYKKSVAIDTTDNRISLEAKLTNAGTVALLHVLNHFSALQSSAETQLDSLSCYAPKIAKQDALINWNRSAELINRQIRAGIGRNPAYSELQGQRIRVIEALVVPLDSGQAPGTILACSRTAIRVACVDDCLDLTILQLPGKTPVPVSALLNSHQQMFRSGNVFSAAADAAAQ